MRFEKLEKEAWNKVKRVLNHHGFPFVPEVIPTELMIWDHEDPLGSHFGIDKTWELISRKYYWPSLCHDFEEYVRGSDVCLASKAIRHKLYGDLQSLQIPTHCWKNLPTDFVTRLPLSTDWKGETYGSILVIVDQLTKIVQYKPVKIIIDAPSLSEVIIDVLVRHHGLPNSIVSDYGSDIISQFLVLFCYFFGIKRLLSTAFYPQTDG